MASFSSTEVISFFHSLWDILVRRSFPFFLPDFFLQHSSYGFPALLHTVVHTSAALPVTPAAAFRLRGFHSWNLSCHEDTTAEGNPDVGVFNTTNIFLYPDVLARANKMPVLTMSVACDRGRLLE